jgi:protein-tyrosine phosphatase
VDEIFWIDGNPAKALAVVLCPIGNSKLKTQLLAMKRGGIETLVSLLEEEEADWLGLAEERRLAEEAGLRFLSFPIPDTEVPPDPTAFRAFIAGLADRVRTGEHIGVHCRGSIGRATVTAACTLIHLGWKPGAALAAVEKARGLAVPDTSQQEEWILGYEVQP